MTDQVENEILEELRKHTAYAKQSNKLNVIAVLILAIFALVAIATPAYLHRSGTSSKSSQHTDNWRAARDLMDNGDLPSALQITKRMIGKNPNYYYGYALLGSIYHETGDLEKAEQNYSKAYDLFPLEENEKTLEAIREAIRKKQE